MIEPFQFPFMQHAALEIALLAPLAGLLGAQIVLRRLAFFTHSVGAASFPGLVIAGPLGIPPALAALGVDGGFAALLERLSKRAGVAADAATALLLVLALAIGIVLASDVFESGASVDQALFGSLLGIGTSELRFSAAALAAALVAALFFRDTWIATGFDAPSARALGLRAATADLVLVVVIAIAVVASLDAVGSLLVSAIFVVPAATVRLFARSLPQLELGAAGLALVEGIGGLLLAYELDAPPGAAIAVLGGAVFAAAALARALTLPAREPATPEAAG